MRLYYHISIVVLLLILGCRRELEVNQSSTEVRVRMNIETAPLFGQPTSRAIADEVKYVTVMLFDRTTGFYNRQFSFDVVGTNYQFNMPIGSWTMVLVGTSDGLAADFATPLQFGATALTDPMLALAQSSSGPTTTREYFYARQDITITSTSTTIPAVTLVRIVGLMTVQASQQLSDSLSYVRITLRNMVPSINFMGTKNTTYVDQVQESTTPISGPYVFKFYGFGSKPLGTSTTDFNIIMDYKRFSAPATLYSFQMDNAGDLQAAGLVPNTRSTITIGI